LTNSNCSSLIVSINPVQELCQAGFIFAILIPLHL
jgi:hypothetical protein